MNADAKPFIPPSLLPVPSSCSGGGAKEDCQKHQHKEKNQNQVHRRGHRPRRRNARRGKNVVDGQSKEEKSSPVGNGNNDNIINHDEGASTKHKPQQGKPTKHQQQHRQKQRRRQRKKGKEEEEVNSRRNNYSEHGNNQLGIHQLEAENSLGASEKDRSCCSSSSSSRHQYQAQRKSIHHKGQTSKRTSHNRTFDIKHEHINTINTIQEAGMILNECSFPTLLETSSSATNPAAVVANHACGDNNTSWNNECLASKLASSLELERWQDRQNQQQLQRERDQDDSTVQLTMLSSSRLSYSIDGKLHVKASKSIIDTGDQEKEEPSTTTPQSYNIQNNTNHQTTIMIPNTRTKWSGSELSKMRQRWWDAVRAKRKKSEDAKRKQRQQQMKESSDTALFANHSGGNEDGGFLKGDGSSSSSSSLGGSSSSSSSSSTPLSSDDESPIIHHVYQDPTQPPSLSTPFDEMAMMNATGPTTTLPPRRQQQPGSPTVSQSIIDLEQFCIQSCHPLHCAIYNHALCYDHRDTASLRDFDGNYDDNSQNWERSEAEVVLQRLLTMHNPKEVMLWKRERVGLLEINGLEAFNVPYVESRAKGLTDMTTSLLSADTTSLTPLQLAICWNLPRIIRLLCTTSVSSNGGNKVEEDDEHGRTPLMLACQLGHAACIQALLCVSSPKLDRREREGGNTAFHFCCMGRSNDDERLLYNHLVVENEEDDLKCDTTACVEAIDMLLRYTPTTLIKRALMLTNFDGQNVLHLACSRGDLGLLERFLGCRNLAGVKISKALDAKDRFGKSPFLAAVAADAEDIVMHLLTTRFTGTHNKTPDFSSWMNLGNESPLIIAVSKNSVNMVNLLLDIGYDASTPYGTVRHLPGAHMMAHNEVNRALLETIYRLSEEEEENSNTYEIIRLLISAGANPHLPVSTRSHGKPMSYLKGRLNQEDIPLSAAVRAADAEAVRCMISTYSSALADLKAGRRNDPTLRSQPESYFQLLEEREDDILHSSVDAALVTSLFLLWQDNNNSSLFYEYGRCGLALYKRGRLNLSSAAVPRNLSQRALQRLEHCISLCLLLPPPMMKDNSAVEGYYFDAPVVQYHIPTLKKKKILDAAPYQFGDWSYVLAGLPWFSSRYNGVCDFMQSILLDPLEMKEKISSAITNDEFFLVVDGEKLLAHKSIVSSKIGKLAAQIRFTEARTRGECSLDRLLVHVNLPLLVAKMMLCHCYHGSIALGLLKSPSKQCHQLLEMALVADEYLCPSLLLECEIRLLMQTSSHGTKSGSLCICPHCSGEIIASNEQLMCPVRLKCLENAKKNLGSDDLSLYCEPVGVYAYKTSTFIISNQSGLITAQSALDVLAVAQQLDQSSSCQNGYAIKYCRSGSIDGPNSTMAMPSFGGWSIDTDKGVGAGCVSVPFSAAKMMSIWVMLRDFPAVIKSDSYLRQTRSNNEDEIAEVDSAIAMVGQAGNDEDAILLLQTCLDELACSTFNQI
ncbi:hypothetical protein ACHAXR_011580 [Thalassiosira sp. AJA248-18]